MDIYILRDGKEIGPFSEETTQSLLKQGSVLINDLAWRPGMAQWIPLHSVLYPPPGTPSAKPPPPPVEELAGAAAEPASERQKAFLSYMGIHFPAEVTKAKAALFVNEAMENPKDPGRLARWNEERLRLHPNLFAAEIRTRKENRANHFFGVVETKGSEFFKNVTKAHCQVLVGYLDVQFPNWDSHEEEAVFNYFFPAIAEKFPQLVTKEGKGKFKYPNGPKVAPELTRHARMPHAKARRSALAAVVRAIGVGAGILLVLFAGHKYLTEKSTRAGITSDGDENAAAGAMSVPNPPALEPAVNSTSLQPDMAPEAQSGGPSGTMNPDPAAATSDPPSAAASDAMPLFDPQPPAATPPSNQTDSSAPPPKSTVVVTKPTEVTTRFGPVKLIAGQEVKLVSREGSMLLIRIGDEELLVPVSSTDLLSSPAASRPSPTPPARPSSAAPVPGSTPAPSATPPPRLPESLF